MDEVDRSRDHRSRDLGVTLQVVKAANTCFKYINNPLKQTSAH